MGYRPNKVSDRKRGFGKIQVHKNKQVIRVTYEDGKIYDIQDFPENVRTCRARIWLSEFGKKMDNFLPADERLKCKVAGFVHEEGKAPALRENPEYESKYFTIKLKVVDGKYKGLEFFDTFNYFIVEGQEKNDQGQPLYALDGTKNEVWRDSVTSFGRFVRFLDVSGIFDALGPFPYRPDMVSVFAKAAARAGKTFTVVTSSKGKVYDYQEEQVHQSEWDDDLFEGEDLETPEDETPPFEPDVEEVPDDDLEEKVDEWADEIGLDLDDETTWETEE